MERVAGRSFAARYREAGPAERRHLAGRFCTLLAQLHALPPGGAPCPSPLAYIRTALPENPVLRWLEERAQAITPICAMTHGDFHGENILMDDAGAMSVIDWSYGGPSDPRLDLANTVLLTRLTGLTDLADAVLPAYEAITGRRPADMDYFETLLLTRRFAQASAGLNNPAAASHRAFLQGFLDKLAELIQARTGKTPIEKRQSN